MKTQRALCLAALGASALAFSACGGGQTRGAAFDLSWTNDSGAGVGVFQKRFASVPVPTGKNVAIGVSGKNTIVGAKLAGGAPWSYEHALDDRPVIAGSVVVGMGGGELFALDAETGRPLWNRNAGGHLRGAGDDGVTTVISIMPTTGKGGNVLAISHDGTVVRQIEDDEPIGVPAVIDGYAFLPWKSQYVTVYDLQVGEERARALIRKQTSRAFVSGGALFFGEVGATRFDDRIAQAPQDKASTVTLPVRELPGAPKWMRSGLEVTPLRAMAPDQIRLYARPTAEGPAAIEGDRYVATYYRVALGLDAKSGALAWVHVGDQAVMGGAAYRGGFALCDGSGKVSFLDAKTGAALGSIELGRAVDACSVQADDFNKTGGEATASLAEQIAAAVAMKDAEHVMVQKLLLREMANLPDELVTTALIDLATDPRTPPLLLEDARGALAMRRNGVPQMLAALEKHVDFLADIERPPPVGPLADALAAMKETRAAPLLAAHLNDPANTPDDARRAAQALVTLATPLQLPALRTFFAHYRCVAEDEEMAKAVASAAAALVKLGGAQDVAHALTDPLTSPLVKPRIEGLVKPSK